MRVDGSRGIARRLRALAALSELQLFFVGGAPRSGTTWLQRIFEAHPEVCCRGEGLIPQRVASPIDAFVAAWDEAVAQKNGRIFKGQPGFPPPAGDEADALLATAILLALDRLGIGPEVRAVGEKTPENVFLFARLKRLFPAARFVAIVRDPRDVLTSAWHFFQQGGSGDATARDAAEEASKSAFVEAALPSLVDGTRAVLDFGRDHPDDLLVVSYEALSADPVAAVARLYAFLGVVNDAALVADCVARTRFAALAGTAGGSADGAFFRKGVVGDWRSTLSQQQADRITETLGFAYPIFGWSA